MTPRQKKILLYTITILLIGGSVYILEETIRLNNTGFEGKSLWDWIDKVLITVVVAILVAYLDRSEKAVEREVAKDNQREKALQTYLDRMATLLVDKQMSLPGNDKEGARDVARTLTLTVLRTLDPDRKRDVVLFLYEANLINGEKPIIPLRQANLRDATLLDANLQNVNLEGAVLRGANLTFAKLQDAYLNDALIEGADLTGADLKGAKVLGVALEAANLEEFDLPGLKGANLSGTTMPDGTVHD